MDPALRRSRITILQKNVNSPNQARENMKLGQPVRVSISFGVQPQQPTPAEETVDQPDTTREMEEPLTIANAQRLEEYLHRLSTSRNNYLTLLRNLTNMLKSLQHRDAQ